LSGVEIERKWLVAQAPADALAAPSELIEQGYLTIGAEGAETRVRRRGEGCFLTVKSGVGLTRAEHEIELSPDQLLRGENGSVIELDVFEGALSGLVVVEVEFDDRRGAESFMAPYWFGVEVTYDPAYKNQRLAVADELPPAPTSR
jgi:adenylate cyclase